MVVLHEGQEDLMDLTNIGNEVVHSPRLVDPIQTDSLIDVCQLKLLVGDVML